MEDRGCGRGNVSDTKRFATCCLGPVKTSRYGATNSLRPGISETRGRAEAAFGRFAFVSFTLERSDRRAFAITCCPLWCRIVFVGVSSSWILAWSDRHGELSVQAVTTTHPARSLDRRGENRILADEKAESCERHRTIAAYGLYSELERGRPANDRTLIADADMVLGATVNVGANRCVILGIGKFRVQP